MHGGGIVYFLLWRDWIVWRNLITNEVISYVLIKHLQTSFYRFYISLITTACLLHANWYTCIHVHAWRQPDILPSVYYTMSFPRLVT